MAAWSAVEAGAPELAASVRGRFEAHLHHVVGTLTASGAPRLSGTEVRFHDGQVWLGCMPGSIKARDLRRDPRVAMHAAPIEVEMQLGDAKLAGTTTEITDLAAITDFLRAVGHGDEIPDGQTVDAGVAAAFVVDIASVSLTRVAGEQLEITTWTEADGVVVRHVS